MTSTKNDIELSEQPEAVETPAKRSMVTAAKRPTPKPAKEAPTPAQEPEDEETLATPAKRSMVTAAKRPTSKPAKEASTPGEEEEENHIPTIYYNKNIELREENIAKVFKIAKVPQRKKDATGMFTFYPVIDPPPLATCKIPVYFNRYDDKDGAFTSYSLAVSTKKAEGVKCRDLLGKVKSHLYSVIDGDKDYMNKEVPGRGGDDKFNGFVFFDKDGNQGLGFDLKEGYTAKEKKFYHTDIYCRTKSGSMKVFKPNAHLDEIFKAKKYEVIIAFSISGIRIPDRSDHSNKISYRVTRVTLISQSEPDGTDETIAMMKHYGETLAEGESAIYADDSEEEDEEGEDDHSYQPPPPKPAKKAPKTTKTATKSRAPKRAQTPIPRDPTPEPSEEEEEEEYESSSEELPPPPPKKTKRSRKSRK
uniref:Uncharacterized protein n=1 Tax=viral metagenome TaxID=1070528 RepID=A0A6C0JUZ2_9ZZZZ